MSASVCGNRVQTDVHDEWEALTLCPGSITGSWWPDDSFGFVDFHSMQAADAARLGLGL